MELVEKHDWKTRGGVVVATDYRVNWRVFPYPGGDRWVRDTWESEEIISPSLIKNYSERENLQGRSGE